MQKEKGFTLIELLVVVAIIGILAAIAIPQFALYRQRAGNSTAQADLRNVATGEEAYFVDNNAYTTVVANLPGTIKASVGTTFGGPSIVTGGFTVTATSSKGNKSYTWNSINGGLQP
jgi:type IV pilus assembly protein PilA